MWYVEYADEGQWRSSDDFETEAEAIAESERLWNKGFYAVNVQISDPFETNDQETMI
jgi:hypothetical protein